ncbi:Cytochrome c-type biogenesis protein CcmI [Crenothrix polyspora]|uniref:Cytochrome c-type biogenesis protein CcmI n=1 Tax=Crenothrix polyspora TaxID=360316 RepID=A0A1R4H8B7_9GAMM|nr:c-type cytochrome biogenesis protein CcmI [Crenothrix polyspora]SJM92492.1 Cytochrome c-type biogenesis protein CcmI [Crenothrix polyspora]
MNIFLLLIVVLLIVAYLIILPPLWRIQVIEDAGFDERNTLIARHRLSELKEQLQSGGLSQALYDEQLAELKQALGDDLGIESHVTTAQTQGRWMVYVLALGIPLLSGLLYLKLGAPQAIDHVEEVAVVGSSAPDSEAINKMVEGLAAKMKANPNDGEGWLMLGRSYKVLQQYPKAVEAFANAHRLLGDKPDVMLMYADALAFANNEKIDGKSAELVFKALAQEPDNLNGLWLGGMSKAQAGDFMGAMLLWKKLESLLPAGSDAQKETQELLAKIASQMPKDAVVPQVDSVQQASNSQATATTEVSVKAAVSLDASLKQSVEPNDTVFIYAQALSGPKMPLAIVRKQVSDLPLSVTLDDSTAMMPKMKLSNFKAVKLMARISKSGNAMPQAGDLIGTVEEVTLADKKLNKIVINNKVK